MIFLLRGTLKEDCEFSDNQWSNLVRKNPNFAMIAANTAGREDYQSWLKQHRSWCFYAKLTSLNDFALIVGKLGEIKGATKCHPI